jgi:hypothetical protein
MLLPALVVAVSLLAEPEAKPDSSPDISAEPPKVNEPPMVSAPGAGPETQVGGVVAPPIMPRGSTALYALLGAPDVGGGYRQGFSKAELEVRLWFNYLQAAATLEVGGKMSVYRKGMLEFVPNLAIGLEGDSGSRYYDKANFAFVALRPRAALITGIRFAESATGIFLIDLPWAIPLTNHAAGGEFTPTAGFGAELMLSKTLSGLVLGQIGLDVIKEPLGVTQLRPAWAIRLGLGFRLF